MAHSARRCITGTCPASARCSRRRRCSRSACDVADRCAPAGDCVPPEGLNALGVSPVRCAVVAGSMTCALAARLRRLLISGWRQPFQPRLLRRLRELRLAARTGLSTPSQLAPFGRALRTRGACASTAVKIGTAPRPDRQRDATRFGRGLARSASQSIASGMLAMFFHSASTSASDRVLAQRLRHVRPVALVVDERLVGLDQQPGRRASPSRKGWLTTVTRVPIRHGVIECARCPQDTGGCSRGSRACRRPGGLLVPWIR